MGFSRKRQSILVGLTKVCASLTPNMLFYFYRIDREVMGAKWSRALALLLCKDVMPHSEKEGTKPPYVCPGCSNHTYSNKMITKFHV
jgi:hypothetical protein